MVAVVEGWRITEPSPPLDSFNSVVGIGEQRCGGGLTKEKSYDLQHACRRNRGGRGDTVVHRRVVGVLHRGVGEP